jgi:hypothetical protein
VRFAFSNFAAARIAIALWAISMASDASGSARLELP